MNLRKLALIAVLSLVVVMLGWWLVSYLTVGKLVITTNSPYDNISIVPSHSLSTSAKGSAQQAKGTLSGSFKAGSYTVTVMDAVDGLSQNVTVKAHATNRYYIKLPATTGVEPVTYDQAQDVAADSNHLVYFNSIDATLNDLSSNNQNNVTNLSNYSLKTISWSDPTYGVAQDSNRQLFVINNGAVHALKSPISNQNDSSATYAVASNRKIYIGFGSSVYSGTEAMGFKKIYDGMAPGSSILAGLNVVGIVNSGYSNSSNNTSSASLTVINSSGKQTTIQFSGFINGWSSWSDNDQHLVIVGDTAGEILDSSLHKVAVIPEANINNPVWLNDNTLFYSVGAQLWSYSLRDQKSQLIANMPLGYLIQQLSVSSDKSYVYVTTSGGNNNEAIRRVGLKGQSVPSYIYQLQDILPIATPGSGYITGLINFSGQPVILITQTPGGPANTQQLATQELQGRGFDTSKFQIKVIQIH